MFQPKFIFLAIIFFLSGYLKSQSKRFFYEYKYISDSLKIDSISTEIMQLDIFKDHSEFLSSQQAKRDSSMFNVKQKSNEIGTNIKEGNVRMKTYKGKENYSIESIGIESYKILSNQNLIWQLHSESKKILNFDCQKATLVLNGRIWIAWFTTEIPIQDGPYIFGNLPGLILEVSDSKKNFSFILVGNSLIKKSSPNITFTNKILTPTISREQFNKKWNLFKKNPIGFREQWVVNNPNIFNVKYYDENGNLQNTDKVYREDREKIKKKIAKNNIFIDEELYK